jgi:hypothetical protein
MALGCHHHAELAKGPGNALMGKNIQFLFQPSEYFLCELSFTPFGILCKPVRFPCSLLLMWGPPGLSGVASGASLRQYYNNNTFT